MTADTYQNLTNTGGGHKPILDLVNLAVGGTRDYAWDAAGNLDSVAPGGNFVDFTFDDASRLAGADRTRSGGGAASFLYDGRGFLRSATQTAGGTASVAPLYESAGLLHALRRQPTPTDPVDSTYVFYLAGRPVAELRIDGTGAETWTYLTTDHLGTPLVATDQTGAITWEGGFRPFGTDYQAGTGNGASENGIPLRLPGQWVDDTWADATSGAGVYYNVWRWLEPQTARYTRTDPFATRPRWPYLYAEQNPLGKLDPLGLYTVVGDQGTIDRALKLLRDLLKKHSDRCLMCQKFFNDLGLDPRLLLPDSDFPFIYTSNSPIGPSAGNGKAPYGAVLCNKAGDEYNGIFIDSRVVHHVAQYPKGLRCLASKLAHELGHYLAKHCTPRDSEGAGAEKACFGGVVEGPSLCGY
jgi:RHS repeat-associated protein